MSKSANKLYEFDVFRLDAAERVLWRNGEMLALPPKVFDTLLMLVENDGRVVSKSELMETIWADAFVEESNLSQNIYTLRRTMGIDEQGRQFIETVPRRGYRFAASVRALSANEVIPVNEEHPRETFLENAATSLSSESPNSNPDSFSFSHTTSDSQANAKAQPLLVSSVALDEKVRRRSSLRYALWAGLGVFLLSTFGFGVYQSVIRRAKDKESAIAPIEQVRFQSLTDSGDVAFPTISPNGELLAYVRLEEEQASVWVKQIATGSSIQTLPPSRRGYASIAFSPDGSYLFFRDEADAGAIYQVSAFGGAPKKVADNVWGDFSVSPDGRQFAFVRRDTGRHAHLLILSNIDGSGERELRARQSRVGYRGGSPAWSPDGTKIIVAGGSRTEARPLLLAVDVSTSQETELKTPRWRDITRALWTPNGKHFIVAARAADESVSQLWMLNFPDGEVRRLTNDLENYFWLSFSADGRKLVTLQQRLASNLWFLPDGDLKKARQLTFGGRNHDGYRGLAWTRESKIVFTSSVGSVTDLYSMNADASNRVQLTANAGQDNTWPTVSRDGDHIVFTSHRTGGRFIWRMDLDGRNQKQLTPGEGPKENAHSPALSPDGAEVFFIKQNAGPTAIWKVSIEGGAATPVSRLTNASVEDFLSISPDGKWIAFRYVSVQPEAKSEKRTVLIGVLPTDGNAEPKLFQLSMRRSMIRWGADSNAFYYSAGTFNSSSLWRQPLDKVNPEKLLDFPDRIFNFAWSPDGKNLVVARGTHQGDAILITGLP
jgi:Tol biopolymer transport system component/DNA-binding winged helix-turn-helix (wHTH) protein